MSWTPKRIYVRQTSETLKVASEDLTDLAVTGKDIQVQIYELVGSGTLRCDPTLALKTLRPLVSSDRDPAIGGTD